MEAESIAIGQDVPKYSGGAKEVKYSMLLEYSRKKMFKLLEFSKSALKTMKTDKLFFKVLVFRPTVHIV